MKRDREEEEAEDVDDRVVHFVVLLDESSSMRKQKDGMIEGVNQMIADQKNSTIANRSDVRILLSLYAFSEHVSLRISRLALDSSSPDKMIDDSFYHPKVGTALYDALGTAISDFGRLSRVVMMVATDGIDNASSTYTRQRVMSLIRHYSREEMGWSFLYVCEGKESFREGRDLGFKNMSIADDGATGARLASGDHKKALGYLMRRASMQSAFDTSNLKSE